VKRGKNIIGGEAEEGEEGEKSNVIIIIHNHVKLYT
jgi:hypothetical protein